MFQDIVMFVTVFVVVITGILGLIALLIGSIAFISVINDYRVRTEKMKRD